MKINEMKEIKDDETLVNPLYDFFDEKSRLNCSKAARVEFTTTVRYIERYLKKGMRILDIGAGAGEYSFYFANKGYQVNAAELADKNVVEFRKKLTDSTHILRMKRLISSCYLARFTICMTGKTATWRSGKQKEY